MGQLSPIEEAELSKNRPKKVCEEARKAGCLFYSMPHDVAPGGKHRYLIDPLMLPVIDAINATGVCWTAESCQGHPEASEPSWADNAEPMLRIVYRAKHEGRVLSALMRACRSMAKGAGSKGPTSIKVFPNFLESEWCETTIYVYASTAWSRDRGVETFMRFAKNLDLGR